MSLDERRSVLDRACPCCTQDPQAPLFSLCSDLVSLSKYGVGYVLYFQLIKLAIFLCFIMSLFKIYKLRENIGSEECTANHSDTRGRNSWVLCIRGFLIFTNSKVYFQTQAADETSILWGAGGLFVVYCLVLYYKQKIVDMGHHLEQEKSLPPSSPSEWTVQISFEKSRPSEDKIRELIYRIAPNVKIQKINSCYKLDEFTEQFNKVSLLKKELRRLKVQEFSRLREEKNKLIAQERENRGSTNILGAEDNLEFSKMATEVTVLST